MENKKNPFLAISYVSVVRGVNISTMSGEEIKASTVITTEEIEMKRMQILKILFSNIVFFLP